MLVRNGDVLALLYVVNKHVLRRCMGVFLRRCVDVVDGGVWAYPYAIYERVLRWCVGVTLSSEQSGMI